MRKCSLFIAEPPGMHIGDMGFYEVELPEYLPKGFKLTLKPWHDENHDQDVTFCVKVTKVELTLLGEWRHPHTAVFTKPVLSKTNATKKQWKRFSVTADV